MSSLPGMDRQATSVSVTDRTRPGEITVSVPVILKTVYLYKYMNHNNYCVLTTSIDTFHHISFMLINVIMITINYTLKYNIYI